MEEYQLFSNNFWGKDDAGHARLIQRMHHAKQTTEELVTFYKERQAIESDYFRKLMALSRKSLGSNETGTLRTSLDTLRKATETTARSHETLARQLHDQISVPLDAFANSMRERRKSAETVMAKLTKAKTAQKQAVSKSRSRYEAECHRISGYQAQRNLLLGKELDKNDARLHQSKIQVEGLQREYQNSLKTLSDTMELWDSEWRQTCDRLQDLEQERIEFTKSNVWQYANAVSTVCVADDEECEAIRVALEKTDAAKDLADFSAKHGTGSQIANPPMFSDAQSGFGSQGETFRQANFSRNSDHHGVEDTPTTMNGSTMSTSASAPYLSVPSSQHSYTASAVFAPASSASAPASATAAAGRNSLTSDEEFRGSSDRNSMLSTNTSISAYSPIQNNSARFEHQPAGGLKNVPDLGHHAKRRSWAMPFKRQSSPDLNNAWKFMNTDEDARDRRDSLASSLRSSLQRQNSGHKAPTNSDVNVGAAGKMDPLVAALERLKCPGPENQVFEDKRDRRKSMGDYRAPRAQSSPNSQIHTDAYPTRRPVAAADTSTLSYTGFALSAQKDQPYREQQQQQATAHYTNTYSENIRNHPSNRPRSKSTVDLRASAATAAVARYPSQSSKGHRVIRHARAQYDYRAAIPEEVSFRKGDVLLVLAMQEDGWWYTEVYGRCVFGLAPSNFLCSI